MKPIFFDSVIEFRNWLEKNSTTQTEIWVGFWKKSSGKTGLTYEQAVEEALCNGWIDGLARAYDDLSYMQRFTPRKSKSVWSKINTQKVEKLIKEGRLTAAGLATVEAAKKDGRWDKAYEPYGIAEVPEDFIKELKKNKKAFEFFESLNKSNKYHVIYQLHNAKKEDTRKRRIEKFIQMFEKGEKFF